MGIQGAEVDQCACRFDVAVVIVLVVASIFHVSLLLPSMLSLLLLDCSESTLLPLLGFWIPLGSWGVAKRSRHVLH